MKSGKTFAHYYTTTNEANLMLDILTLVLQNKICWFFG